MSRLVPSAVRVNILTIYQGGGNGGDYTAAMQLHRALIAEGQNSVFCHIRRNRYPDGDYSFVVPRAAAEGVALHQTPTWPEVKRFVRECGVKFDVGHLHAGDRVPGLKDVLGFRRSVPKVPLVLSAHGQEDINEAGRRDLTWKFFIAERLCSRVIVPSEHKRQVVAQYSKIGERLMAVPNVVMPGNIIDRQVARKKLGLPADGPVLTFVGILRKQKRADEVIRMLPILDDLGVKPHVVIAGDGPDGDSVRELARPYGARIKMLGYIADPSAAFSAGDVFVFPSEIESFGLVLMEAGTYGLPVVSAALPITENEFKGMPGYYQHAIGDLEGIATQVKRALDERTPEQAEAERLEVDRRFGPHVVAQKHLAVYEAVIRERNGRR